MGRTAGRLFAQITGHPLQGIVGSQSVVVVVSMATYICINIRSSSGTTRWGRREGRDAKTLLLVFVFIRGFPIGWLCLYFVNQSGRVIGVGLGFVVLVNGGGGRDLSCERIPSKNYLWIVFLLSCFPLFSKPTILMKYSIASSASHEPRDPLVD